MSDSKRSKPVPKSRSSRLLRMAGMATGIAASAVLEKGRQLANGQRPELKELFLTPANAKRVTKQLGEMRGAAMKLGQIISMEGEAIISPQLAEILADLRANATSMPATQLHAVMSEALGAKWRDQFASFANTPIASASIGQVHRAISLEGELLAVKVQYPGVADSIDSDVNNMATLLNLTRLVPKQIELDPLLSDAKKLLHQEADYLTEAKYLAAFESALKEDERFIVPQSHAVLSNQKILVMDYIDGAPIERLASESNDIINHAMTSLFSLFLLELFDLRMMQTDPNFANYRFQLDNDENVKIGLLDFGASQTYTKAFSANYLELVRATIDKNDEQVLTAAKKLGYELEGASLGYQQLLLDILYLALEPFSSDENYDFTEAKLGTRVADLAQESYAFKRDWTAPPTETLYVHRKLGGLYMLAERIGAKVNLSTLLTPYLDRKLPKKSSTSSCTHSTGNRRPIVR